MNCLGDGIEEDFFFHASEKKQFTGPYCACVFGLFESFFSIKSQ